MATYKKHGKSKLSREEKMEKRSSTARFFGKLDYLATLFEDWVARNRKVIFSIIALIIVGVLGYLAYDNFVLKPKQEEAVKEMSQSMNYFDEAIQSAPGKERNDFFEKALNGNGGFGLLDIIEDFKGTDAANIAEYSAGIAYLNLEKYSEAIAHLEKFSGKDEFLPAIAKGAIGDAFMGNNQPEEALDYYIKAAKIRTNTFTTPKYLFKAAVTAIQLKQNDKAEGFLKEIKEKYPDSKEANKVPAYLGMVSGNTK